jgi:DNA-binding NarL/FixJ family response regulator
VLDELSPSKSLRVVIADDHPFYREGLARSLRGSGIEVLDAGPSAEAVISVVEKTAPDVVIMDLGLPGLSGLEATRRLRETAPASQVLVISVSAEEADMADAILAGASGYVLKDRPVEEVIAAIRAVAAGEALLSSRTATALLRRVRDLRAEGEEAGGMRLSSRELAVLSLLAEGKAIDEIAGTLQADPDAVQNHISSILAKLRVRGRSGLSSSSRGPP